MSGDGPAQGTAGRRSVVQRLAIDAGAALDVAVLTLLSLIGLIGFATAYDGAGFLRAGIGGILVGIAAGVAAHLWRTGPLVTVVISVAAFFVFGTAFAVPALGVVGVLPTLASIAALATGSVFGWADLVTLRAPVSLPDYVNAVPYLVGWLVSLVTAVLAIRWLPTGPRTLGRTSLLLIGPVLLYLAGVLFGTDEPYLAALRGISFAVIALIWLGRRRSRIERADAGATTLTRRRLVGSVLVLAASAALAAVVGAAIAPTPDDRFVLREEVVPPFEPLDYPSPLAGFREYTKTLETTPLFTVAGLPAGQRIRLATMDSYDGILFGVAGAEEATEGSGSFRLVGRSFPTPDVAGDSAEITIRMAGYDDVWIPSVGYPTAIAFAGGKDSASDIRDNPATGTAVLTTGLDEGSEYRMSALVPRMPTVDELAGVPVEQVELAPAENIPDVVAAKALEYAADADDPATQLENIAVALSSTGFLSHGRASDPVTSRAGHSADRLVELFTRSQLVGDQEQYATAMALMARSLGMPARVVMGFDPAASGSDVEPGATVEVTGDDVTAWVEVPFEGVGWVPFDPTPEQTDVPQDQVPTPQNEPQPQVRQPPRTQTDQDDLVSAVEVDDSEEEPDDPGLSLPGWVIGAAIGLAVPAAIVLVPALIVAALKARRRRRRRSSGAGDLRIAGAWDELLDRFSELGYEIPSRSTRAMVARRIGDQTGDEPGERVLTIARGADDAVFSGVAIEDDRVDRVWHETESAAEQVRASTPRGRRLLSRYRLGAVQRGVARLARTDRR